ncbi:MAG: helix-turn-helix transcriptional regulator [Oscillospiraceae bacterium]|nr:helix-turn-helix transcriptional regulator [Oscillospiraceae bacterium]
MITFDKLWTTMEQKGVSTYWLREKCGFDRKTIRRLRANENVETKTLNKLCTVLECSLNEIAEFIPDES